MLDYVIESSQRLQHNTEENLKRATVRMPLPFYRALREQVATRGISLNTAFILGAASMFGIEQPRLPVSVGGSEDE